MSKAVFLLQPDGNLVEMVEQPYASEDLLQSLIAKYPNLLAGDSGAVESSRKWLLICREATIGDSEDSNGRWSLDHLFIDSEGVPTLVEVKRSTDTRLRREVVGQMLDYASNAVLHWPLERIRAMHQSWCESEGIDAERAVQDFAGPELTAEGFWKAVKTNLQAGRVRLVFLADEIPSELRRVIEFLNTQMDPAEVIGIELKQFAGSNVRTIVPALIGQTEAATTRKSNTRAQRQWDEQSFMKGLAEQASPKCVSAAKLILDWARPRTSRFWFGSGARSGSIFPVLDHGGVGYTFFALWSYGSAECLFQYFRGVMQEEKNKMHLASLLNEISGVRIEPAMFSKRPSISLEKLASPAALQKFLDAFQWAIDEVKRS